VRRRTYDGLGPRDLFLPGELGGVGHAGLEMSKSMREWTSCAVREGDKERREARVLLSLRRMRSTAWLPDLTGLSAARPASLAESRRAAALGAMVTSRWVASSWRSSSRGQQTERMMSEGA